MSHGPVFIGHGVDERKTGERHHGHDDHHNDEYKRASVALRLRDAFQHSVHSAPPGEYGEEANDGLDFGAAEFRCRRLSRSRSRRIVRRYNLGSNASNGSADPASSNAGSASVGSPVSTASASSEPSRLDNSRCSVVDNSRRLIRTAVGRGESGACPQSRRQSEPEKYSKRQATTSGTCSWEISSTPCSTQHLDGVCEFGREFPQRIHRGVRDAGVAAVVNLSHQSQVFDRNLKPMQTGRELTVVPAFGPRRDELVDHLCPFGARRRERERVRHPYGWRGRRGLASSGASVRLARSSPSFVRRPSKFGSR